jgi:hypothetical protein
LYALIRASLFIKVVTSFMSKFFSFFLKIGTKFSDNQNIDLQFGQIQAEISEIQKKSEKSKNIMALEIETKNN